MKRVMFHPGKHILTSNKTSIITFSTDIPPVLIKQAKDTQQQEAYKVRETITETLNNIAALHNQQLEAQDIITLKDNVIYLLTNHQLFNIESANDDIKSTAREMLTAIYAIKEILNIQIEGFTNLLEPAHSPTNTSAAQSPPQTEVVKDLQHQVQVDHPTVEQASTTNVPPNTEASIAAPPETVDTAQPLQQPKETTKVAPPKSTETSLTKRILVITLGIFLLLSALIFILMLAL